jgi:hypothetical protein
LARKHREWYKPVRLWPLIDLDFLRQKRFRVPISCADGASIMVRMARLERVKERITAESGVRRGLSERHVTLCICALDGYGVFR